MEKKTKRVHLMGSSILKTSIFLGLLQYFIYYFFTPSLLLCGTELGAAIVKVPTADK